MGREEEYKILLKRFMDAVEIGNLQYGTWFSSVYNDAATTLGLHRVIKAKRTFCVSCKTKDTGKAFGICSDCLSDMLNTETQNAL